MKLSAPLKSYQILALRRLSGLEKEGTGRVKEGGIICHRTNFTFLSKTATPTL